MHPGIVAERSPDKVAWVMAGTGRQITFSQLEAAANRGAHLFRSLGLARGDHIVLLLENHPRFLEICWAAQRAGLYYTPISRRLAQAEMVHVVNDCGATVLISSHRCRALAANLLDGVAKVARRFMVDGTVPGFDSWEAATASLPTGPIEDQSEGMAMLYSSGATGVPRGIRKPLPAEGYGEGAEVDFVSALHGAGEESVYLVPAPLYHAPLLRDVMGLMRRGIQVVVMEHFDPEQALGCIQDHRVTHSQWQPAMFVSLLKLPSEARLAYDTSSLERAIHTGAPCPIPVKEQMIDWWGPILHEYYAGIEDNGLVQLDSQEWLAHKGSVGRPLNCRLHICDEDGSELPVGEPGTIYFSGGGEFEPAGDPEQAAGSRHPEGWTTLGDLGYLDEEGYLYLTDRRHFRIITGGVSVYPQEAENVLITHDAVMDVAVIGVPSEALGEEVRAVVQPRDMAQATPELALELLDYCRARLSLIKCPRAVDFRAGLPRDLAGERHKRLLKEAYLQNA